MWSSIVRASKQLVLYVVWHAYMPRPYQPHKVAHKLLLIVPTHGGMPDWVDLGD